MTKKVPKQKNNIKLIRRQIQSNYSKQNLNFEEIKWKELRDKVKVMRIFIVLFSNMFLFFFNFYAQIVIAFIMVIKFCNFIFVDFILFIFLIIIIFISTFSIYTIHYADINIIRVIVVTFTNCLDFAIEKSRISYQFTNVKILPTREN